jgi:hypothetical protein
MFMAIFGFDGGGKVGAVPAPPSSWRCHMPWYWTDEVAPVLIANGSIDAEVATSLISLPVAHRSEQDTVEEAARELMEDGEIPLAA